MGYSSTPAMKQWGGWCQYGLKEELPRIDAKRNYRRLHLGSDGNRLWRITCFVVNGKYRERGAASLALEAALKAIKSKGGGLVEAYPPGYSLGSLGKLVWD